MRVAATAVAAGVVAIYALRLDHAVGLIVDDAWYVVLTKALAEGRGFRLISSAAAEILPAVPPGFPAILSPVFLVSPSFPGNLIWLKLISVLAMLAAGVVCWLDLTRHRDVPPAHALLLTAATLITPALVFLATSTVMAECVFTLAQLLTVFLVERVRRGAGDSNGRAVIAGVAGAAAILIRVPGAAVVAAAVVYLFVGGRWRQAAVIGATTALCVAPWFLYARAHEPTAAERLSHGGTIAFSYQQLVTMKRPGDVRSGEVTFGDRLVRAQSNVVGILSRDVGAILVPALYRGPSESGQEVVSIVGGTAQVGSMGRGGAIAMVSLVLSGVMLTGWLGAKREWLSMPALLIAASFALIALVGAQTFRYLVPLTPYLLLFLWRGLRGGSAARIAVLCLLGLNLLDHTLYIQRKLTGIPEWLQEAAEVDSVMNWMAANLKEPGSVASNNPGLVYLRTGRKSIATSNPSPGVWRALGVRYMVAVHPAEQPGPSFDPRPLFQTAGGRLWIVQIFTGGGSVNLTSSDSPR